MRHLNIGLAKMFAVVVIVLGLGIDVGAPALAAEVRTPMADSDFVSFRDSVGFASDPGTIAAAVADPSSSWKYGVPLTRAETSELDRRGRITSELGPLSERLADVPTFGGMWFDQRAGGVIDIATSGSLSEVDDIVRGQLPDKAEYRLRHVDFPIGYLLTLQQRVEAEQSKWTDAGVIISEIGVDIPTNRLVIGVEGLDENTEKQLIDLYGASVVVKEVPRLTPAACLSRTNCGTPIKGGIAIDAANGYQCTATMLGRTSGLLRIMTAGHCGVGGAGLGKSWYHHGVNLGSMVGYVYPAPGGTAEIDFAVISAAESGTRNLVYGQDLNAIESVEFELANSGQGYGVMMCRAGRTSGYSCHPIVGTLQTRTYSDGVTIKHLWIWDHASAGGDSGGPMLHFDSFGVYIGGVVSATDGTITAYSTIEFIKQYYGNNTRACITPAC